ncbi:lytic transglycosylase domain-containing protein [Kiritimatiellaeota bacterium B1221]|nr:lytic transglycosylase domain-containing protein [Kiritimatiellaeota bacterium B1221]
MRKRLSNLQIVSALLLLALGGAGLWIHHVDRNIWKAGRKNGVDPLLLRAVGITESRLNPKAVGAAGEIGMFQIMPNTAKHWAQKTGHKVPTEKQLFKLRVNANISAWYLREGLDEFADKEDPTAYALAYYNAGPSRVRAWEDLQLPGIPFVEGIPFPGTRKYVTQILGIYRGEK